ncbi:MAG: 50S ribosomal protein L24 [Candidatus Jacksonbacteria bacterium]|jgi:large subunit ribosomal protein L24|nr:50S ribosomal protein L24 [Candidatus Jacksonbacteria bacterium]MBT6034080.1 50S ribosomal protein L24 [Candidatus Jacksonbacteria bacterium]MBT6301115.1 50S ribosomal protein L24 [Candidatus Jacksonbacteria bacterium]MBT6757302.1 50S ribosomal protein L24 [Candidatus Jacksonbacteria bacterium]MBT6955617.1 50S ribosomal protein L24 [Candidatus Jacksonbacteria bacterium]
MKMIKKNDIVIILAGKDKGKEGKVLQVFPKIQRVAVEGVNKAKKHLKSGKENEKGQIITYDSPLNLSNVALKDPKTGKPTRVKVKKLEDGTKVRVSTSSQEVIK